MWVVFTLVQLLNRSPIWNRTVSAAFNVSRGLALAVLMAGISVGQLLTPIVATALIHRHGWRGRLWAAGAWLVRDHACARLCSSITKRKSAKTASPETTQPATAEGGLTLGEALRDPAMLRIAFASMVQSTLYTASPSTSSRC
jgi:MFS family permease